MDKSSVVLEIGGCFTKCGFSPESTPRFILPTNLLPLSISTYLSSGTVYDNTNNINDKKPTLPTQNQLKESLYDFIHSLYFEYLLVKSDERKLIIVENLYLPRLFRQCLVSVLFEQFKVPLIVFVNPLACLVPILKNTALIIDCGYSESRVYPVYEGIGVVKAFETISLGFQILENQLHYKLLKDSATIIKDNKKNQMIIDPDNNLALLSKYIGDSDGSNSDNNKRFKETSILSDIIVKTCLCTINNNSNTNTNNNVIYKLDKDYSIEISSQIRNKLVDRLYRNEMEQENESIDQQRVDTFEEGNLVTMILDSLLKCEHDQRKALAHNILLIGGTTMIPGFKRKLVYQLTRTLDQDDQYVSLKPLAKHFNFIQHPFQANYLSWLGGSLLGNVLDQVHSKISIESYLQQRTQYPSRAVQLPEIENLANINNYTQIISSGINPLQFTRSAQSLFSPYTSSSDFSAYLPLKSSTSSNE
ncbi:hypothetical protein CYY_000756 [Polysphondylium violaceum]|uniref:Actin related protein 11 n=1 Tax=Polysphondylium violaceum TaxID=133409 RepID=A0A8J4UWW5_9MYCE|nr:hypothetical protein CYY_000756 [Polysphondylium violaceum]